MDRPEKIANGFMGLVFLFAAAVQYNDPDPLVWISVYLIAAAASLLPLVGHSTRWLALALAVVCLPWAVALALRVLGRQPILESEEGREMLGLLLVVVWMASLVVREGRRRRAVSA
jgi:FtsH-binding integral membrane protein